MPLLRDSKPKHAKPSKAAPALAVGGLTASFGTAVNLAASAEAATAQDFSRLRQCESGGDYAINTGNGYYGAYQFNLRTWRGLGYAGYPHQASPATQDRAARELQADRGWQPWPACSRKLGLGRSDSADSADSRDDRVVQRASRSQRRVIVAGATAVPAFERTLTTKLVKAQRSDVRAWQARMKARGWDIAVDGRYGPKSARVAARFTAEKGLSTPAGTVDAAAWRAAWALPVT